MCVAEPIGIVVLPLTYPDPETVRIPPATLAEPAMTSHLVGLRVDPEKSSKKMKVLPPFPTLVSSLLP
jgi:hypothetical protein